MRSHHKRPDFLRIYHCDECAAWHLAHGKDHKSKFLPSIKRPRYSRA